MVELVVCLELAREMRVADLEVVDLLGVFGEVVVQVAVFNAQGGSLLVAGSNLPHIDPIGNPGKPAIMAWKDAIESFALGAW